MYCSYYGLTEKPFAITPNPRFVFPSKNHREAFAHLVYGIDNHAGFIELTGEVGTGKTTVLRTLLGQLDEEKYRCALIFNPSLSALDLLRMINREFGLPCTSLNNSRLLEHLYEFLLKENAAGRTVVLVIDEAQNLAPQVLEQVRLISNLETETDKLIQIVLAGQPELRQMLSRPELRQINQRITVRHCLEPIDYEDMKIYLEHRLEVAGGKWAASFTPDALRMLYRASGGIPRLINVICDRALLIGYTEESREITRRMMTQAIAESSGSSGGAGKLRRKAAAVAIAALACVLAVVAGWRLRDRAAADIPRTTPTPAALSMEPPVTIDDLRTTTFESALAVLLPLWQAPPAQLSPTAVPEKSSIGEGLGLCRFNGSLGLITRIGTPALLELVPVSGTARNFVALTGISPRGVVVQRRDRTVSVPRADLDRVWSGRVFFPWKNSLGINVPLREGLKDRSVAGVQELLAKAGAYAGRPSGKFDGRTVAAVKRFQASWGITADGRVGEQTLFLLYRTAEPAASPQLKVSEG